MVKNNKMYNNVNIYYWHTHIVEHIIIAIVSNVIFYPFQYEYMNRQE